MGQLPREPRPRGAQSVYRPPGFPSPALQPSAEGLALSGRSSSAPTPQTFSAHSPRPAVAARSGPDTTGQNTQPLPTAFAQVEP